MLIEDVNVIPLDLIIYCDLTKLCPYLKIFNTNLMFTKWLFHSPSNIEHVYLLYIENSKWNQIFEFKRMDIERY